MATQHLSIRMDADALERLDAQSRRERMTRSELARTLIEEGLRMEKHPGIVFRHGPTGRRAGLVNGPDVWEVIRVYRELDDSGEALVTRLAELATIEPYRVHTALQYYAAYPDEIDERIALDSEAAALAETDRSREQALLRQ